MPEEASAPVKMHFDEKDVKDNTVIAALSYIGILCLIPLLAKKDSRFAQEHGKQGLILVIAWICVAVVSWIPILGWIVGFFGSIILLVVDLVAFIKCLMGEFWDIPVIGQYRSKINI